jgi:DNA end-binding protein Ku
MAEKEGPSRPTRPYWKGYLRLALVTIPIQVHSATESGRLALNQIHKPSGQRVNYEVTAGGQPVDMNDVVKGYPVAEDTYVLLEPEELAAVKLDTMKTIDLKEFIKVEEIAPPYFERPYYLVPEDEFAVEGYQVIVAALQKEKRLGLGQVVMGSGRENLVAVGALGKGHVCPALPRRIPRGRKLLRRSAGGERSARYGRRRAAAHQ